MPYTIILSDLPDLQPFVDKSVHALIMRDLKQGGGTNSFTNGDLNGFLFDR